MPSWRCRFFFEDVDEFLETRTNQPNQIHDGVQLMGASLPREQYHLNIAYITRARNKKEVETKSGTLPADEGNDDDKGEVKVVEETKTDKNTKYHHDGEVFLSMM